MLMSRHTQLWPRLAVSKRFGSKSKSPFGYKQAATYGAAAALGAVCCSFPKDHFSCDSVGERTQRAMKPC